MCHVAKAILFLFCSFFMLQHFSIGNSMQQADELVELQSVRRPIVQNRKEGLNTILHEEVPLLPGAGKKPSTWKQNWFVKNIIVEFPIIGDFFYDDISILDALRRGGKSTSMLLGGSVGMMLNFIPMSEKEDMAVKMAKSSINMAIGMWIATSAYNTILSLAHMGYDCIKGEENL